MTHHIVAYLISMAVGYWLLTLAEKEHGLTKTLGRIVAGIIIGVSLLGPICSVAGSMCRDSNGGACGYSQGCPTDKEGCGRHGMGWRGMMKHRGMMHGHEGMEGKGMMKDEGAMEDKSSNDKEKAKK